MLLKIQFLDKMLKGISGVRLDNQKVFFSTRSYGLKFLALFSSHSVNNILIIKMNIVLSALIEYCFTS